MPPNGNSVDVVFVEKNQSSMTMVMKEPEPREPATGQDTKLFWLDPLAESIVRSMESLHAAFLVLDMVLALHVNSHF